MVLTVSVFFFPGRWICLRRSWKQQVFACESKSVLTCDEHCPTFYQPTTLYCSKIINVNCLLYCCPDNIPPKNLRLWRKQTNKIILIWMVLLCNYCVCQKAFQFVVNVSFPSHLKTGTFVVKFFVRTFLSWKYLDRNSHCNCNSWEMGSWRSGLSPTRAPSHVSSLRGVAAHDGVLCAFSNTCKSAPDRAKWYGPSGPAAWTTE